MREDWDNLGDHWWCDHGIFAISLQFGKFLKFFPIVILCNMSEKRVVLVTGGTGLVGKGIELALKEIGQDPNDTFVFLSSKDGDIT